MVVMEALKIKAEATEIIKAPPDQIEAGAFKPKKIPATMNMGIDLIKTGAMRMAKERENQYQ